jgi:hypothetical protein
MLGTVKFFNKSKGYGFITSLARTCSYTLPQWNPPASLCTSRHVFTEAISQPNFKYRPGCRSQAPPPATPHFSPKHVSENRKPRSHLRYRRSLAPEISHSNWQATIGICGYPIYESRMTFH